MNFVAASYPPTITQKRVDFSDTIMREWVSRRARIIESLRFFFLVPIGFLLLSTSPIFSEEKELVNTGIAKDKRGKELYKEVHHMYYDGDRLLRMKSEMFDTTGKPLAVITSDFSHSQELPNYHVDNKESDEEEDVQVNGDTVLVNYRSMKGKALQTKTFQIKPSMVSGYGVNVHIGNHLNAIASGATERVKLLVVPRMNTYSMKYKQTQVEGFEDNPDAIGVLFNVDLGFFSVFLPSAKFVYDKKTKKLLYFNGPSNIVFKNGSRPNVSITYSSPD